MNSESDNIRIARVVNVLHAEFDHLLAPEHKERLQDRFSYLTLDWNGKAERVIAAADREVTQDKADEIDIEKIIDTVESGLRVARSLLGGRKK